MKMQLGVCVATISARTPISVSSMMNLRHNPASAFAVVSVFFVLSTVFSASAQTAFSPQDPVIERMQVKADALEQSMQRLTGRMEQMGFQNNQLRSAIEDQNALIERLTMQVSKLEARVGELEAIANAATERAASAASSPREDEFSLVGPTTSTTMQSKAANRGEVDETLESKAAMEPTKLTLEDTPEGLFKQAKNLLVRGDYPAAETAFEEFLTTYAEDTRAAEAQYWLGESLLIQEAYPEATEAYVTLVSTWPEAEKAPDALIKLARSLRMMGQPEDACEALGEVSRMYPDAGPVIRSSVARERDRADCDAA